MTLRDDFPVAVKEALAKRVSQCCSNPGCRQSTSGPHDDPAKAINVGVAAHIAAASPGGPRFESSMTAAQRSAIENGIWLCQTCAKLIDSDPAFYTTEVVRAWRTLAEATARRDLEQRRDPRADEPFRRLERDMPTLLAEMRADLQKHPIAREFILFKKSWSYNGDGRLLLTYFYDDHPDLDSKILIMQNVGVIRDITFNNVKRYAMQEELVDYLRVPSSAGSEG
jgi:hypothetical protein